MEKIYAIWLAEAFGAGSRISPLLCEYYNSFEAIYNADSEELALISGITGAHITRLNDKTLQRAEEIFAECVALGINIVTIFDDAYPENLFYIHTAGRHNTVRFPFCF